MAKTKYYLEKMDCSSEEQMVRMKLGDMEEVKGLEFDLTQRQLTVHHTDNRMAIGSALESLGLGLEEIEHEANVTVATGV